MELEFHLYFFKELEFMGLEYFTWNSSFMNSRSRIFYFILF